MQPGRSSRKAHISAMSAAYSICVRCFSTCVHSSGVGASRYMYPSPGGRAVTMPPNDLPIKSCTASHTELAGEGYTVSRAVRHT